VRIAVTRRSGSCRRSSVAFGVTRRSGSCRRSQNARMVCGLEDSLITLSLVSESKTHGYLRRVYALNSRWTGDSRGKALAKPEIVEPTGKNAFVSAELPAASITKEFRTDGLEVRGSPSLQGGILALHARSKIGRGVCRLRPSLGCADVHERAGEDPCGVCLSPFVGGQCVAGRPDVDRCLVVFDRWFAPRRALDRPALDGLVGLPAVMRRSPRRSMRNLNWPASERCSTRADTRDRGNTTGGRTRGWPWWPDTSGIRR
jgi:hypothetical protein